jgi:DNA-binding LytR/AlgR family response regulator
MGNGVLIINRFRIAYLPWDDIFFIIKNDRRILVYTKDDEYWEYGNIERIIAVADDRFYQCHKSLMVNLAKLQSINADHAVLIDGRPIHMCRAYLQRTKKKFLKYRKENR